GSRPVGGADQSSAMGRSEGESRSTLSRWMMRVFCARVHLETRCRGNHLGSFLALQASTPWSKYATGAYGEPRSELSYARTIGSRAIARSKLAIERGYRSTSFWVGTSWPPWLARMATRCSDTDAAFSPMKMSAT